MIACPFTHSVDLWSHIFRTLTFSFSLLLSLISLYVSLVRSLHISCVVCCPICNRIFAGYWWCNCNLSKRNCRKSIHFSSFRLILMIPCDIIFVTKNQTRKNTNKPKMCVCVYSHTDTHANTHQSIKFAFTWTEMIYLSSAHKPIPEFGESNVGQGKKRKERTNFSLYWNSFH